MWFDFRFVFMSLFPVVYLSIPIWCFKLNGQNQTRPTYLHCQQHNLLIRRINGPQYNLLSCLSFLYSCYPNPGGFSPVQGAPETCMTPHGYGPPQPFLNKLHGYRGQLVLVHGQNYRAVGREATVYRWPIWPSRQLFRWEWQRREGDRERDAPTLSPTLSPPLSATSRCEVDPGDL